jgi:hypothetical protein
VWLRAALLIGHNLVPIHQEIDAAGGTAFAALADGLLGGRLVGRKQQRVEVAVERGIDFLRLGRELVA